MDGVLIGRKIGVAAGALPKALLVAFSLLFFAQLTSAQTVVTLRVPADNANVSSQQVNFSATIDAMLPLANVSVYTNLTGAWARNSTNSSLPASSTGIDFVVSNNPEATRAVWNVQACTADACAFASSNSTVIVDITAPNLTSANSPSNGATVSSAVTFNVTAKDNVELENVSIYHNATGTWHRNATNSSLTAIHNNTPLLVVVTGLPSGNSSRWLAEVCDVAGYCAFYNANRTFTVSASDSAPPQYASNQTNSTANGTAVLFSLYWTDNIALSNYTFSFDNGTGTFTNDSSVAFSGTTNHSNATKYVNQSNGTTIRWIVYAWDVTGNMNASATYSFVTNSSAAPGADTQPPQYSANQTNTTIAGQAIKFSLYWTDNIALANYTFSFDNGSGSFTNDSTAGFSGTTNHSNVTKVVNSTIGAIIRWQVWANDSSNNMNASLIYKLTTTSANLTNTPPSSAMTPEITPDPADNSTALNCTANFVDTTNSQLTYIYDWYKDNAQNTSLDSNMTSVSNGTSTTTNTSVPVALLSVGSAWICSARAFDGTYFSDWVNSTPVEILASVNNIVTRTTISCPSTLTNTAGTITVAYYNKNKLSCTGITLLVQNSTGSNLTTVIGAQKCVSNKATYPVNFTKSGTYTILALAGGSSSSCAIEYKGVSLLPTRIPDFSPLLLPLVAFAAIGLARNHARKSKKN